MNKNDNPYEVLELTTSADEKAIKKAYRQLARKYHPDKQKTDEERAAATAHFAKISDAYDLLSDPVKRYDWRIANESSQSGSSTSATPQTRRSTTNTTQMRSSTPPPSASRARTPPPAPTSQRMPHGTMRGTRASFATPQASPVGRRRPSRPSSLGPGGAAAATGGMRGKRSSSAGRPAARRSSSPSPARASMKSASPGPGGFRQRANIPRQSMKSAKPLKRASYDTTTSTKKVLKPLKRASYDTATSTKKVLKPKSSPGGLGAPSEYSRRRQLGLDGRPSDHVRRVPRSSIHGSMHGSVHSSMHGSVHSSMHGSVHSSMNGSVHSSMHGSSDNASVFSSSSGPKRRPMSSRDSVTSMNTAAMRRVSSRDSGGSVSKLRPSRSDPDLHKKKTRFSIRGSSANMKNETFNSPARTSKGSISRRFSKLNPLMMGKAQLVG